MACLTQLALCLVSTESCLPLPKLSINVRSKSGMDACLCSSALSLVISSAFIRISQLFTLALTGCVYWEFKMEEHMLPTGGGSALLWGLHVKCPHIGLQVWTHGPHVIALFRKKIGAFEVGTTYRKWVTRSERWGLKASFHPCARSVSWLKLQWEQLLQGPAILTSPPGWNEVTVRQNKPISPLICFCFCWVFYYTNRKKKQRRKSSFWNISETLLKRSAQLLMDNCHLTHMDLHSSL